MKNAIVVCLLTITISGCVTPAPQQLRLQNSALRNIDDVAVVIVAPPVIAYCCENVMAERTTYYRYRDFDDLPAFDLEQALASKVLALLPSLASFRAFQPAAADKRVIVGLFEEPTSLYKPDLPRIIDYFATVPELVYANHVILVTTESAYPSGSGTGLSMGRTLLMVDSMRIHADLTFRLIRLDTRQVLASSRSKRMKTVLFEGDSPPPARFPDFSREDRLQAMMGWEAVLDSAVRRGLIRLTTPTGTPIPGEDCRYVAMEKCPDLQ